MKTLQSTTSAILQDNRTNELNKKNEENEKRNIRQTSLNMSNSGQKAMANYCRTLPRKIINSQSQKKKYKKKKRVIKIGTWNVKTLLQLGKLENVMKEIIRMDIEIMGLSEVRWTGSGKMHMEEGTMFYSGGEERQRGVAVIIVKKMQSTVINFVPLSDRIIWIKIENNPTNINIIQVYAPTSLAEEEEIENFYDNLEEAMKLCKSNEILFIIGDSKAIVGKHETSQVTGQFGLGERNARGNMLVDWCNVNNFIITNTWFQHHWRKLYTWISPDGHTKNQIDFIITINRYKNAVKNRRTYPGANCNSDHNPVVADIKITWKKVEPQKKRAKRNMKFLLENEVIKEK